MAKNLILTINPGSTSTKIALFEEDKNVFEKNLKHSAEELERFTDIISQYGFRKNLIVDAINESEYELSDIAIIVGRGGALKPMPSGTYIVNQKMIDDLVAGAARTGHASCLGGIIADDLAKEIDGANAYIADPPVVDEMTDVARISGHPAFYRESIFHALNQKAIARRHAKVIGKKYEELKLIVVHLGGGISIGAHDRGRVVDVNDALSGEGPMSPERSGAVPSVQLFKLCFSGKHEKEEIQKMLVGKGGISAYLGTSDMLEVDRMVEEGDEKATLIFDAMIYQIARYIGGQYTVFDGEIDGIIITGGIARSALLIDKLKKKVEKIAEVYVYPGEDEMEALASNGKLILDGELEPIEY